MNHFKSTETSDPDHSRRVITDLLAAQSSQETLDLVCALLAELSVIVLHSKSPSAEIPKPRSSHLRDTSDSKGSFNNVKRVSTASLKNDQSSTSTIQFRNTNSKTSSFADLKPTRLGSVSLPKVLDDFELSSAKPSSNGKNLSALKSADLSGSDIPSQSSESSNDDAVMCYFSYPYTTY